MIGIVAIVLLVAFAIGFALASIWIKNNIAAQVFVGFFLGIGLLVVRAGVIFTGCLIVLSNGA